MLTSTVCQYQLLIAILYLRLKVVFTNTAFALSRCTNISFPTCLIVSICFGIAGICLITFMNIERLGFLTYSFGGFIAASLSAYLLFLFLYKLFKVCQSIKEADNRDELSDAIMLVSEL